MNVPRQKPHWWLISSHTVVPSRPWLAYLRERTIDYPHDGSYPLEYSRRKKTRDSLSVDNSVLSFIAGSRQTVYCVWVTLTSFSRRWSSKITYAFPTCLSLEANGSRAQTQRTRKVSKIQRLHVQTRVRTPVFISEIQNFGVSTFYAN